eukprot:TRINITY_DN1007_c0_g1_i6.p1 TRINITY_DN1007_c0_g1~~TRINITY_DN1007_c0_g1_i6.p1  ORF type:complete len:362 (-),score=53.94 TRINITY_DN1007_c0_g1_i6:119-1204(-)
MCLRLLIPLLSCVLLCAAAQYPCTYKDYDLSGMYRTPDQDDYSWVNPTGDDTFYINICGEPNDPCDPSSHAGVCEDSGANPPVYYPCGDASKGEFGDYPKGEEGVQLVYGSGQDCNGVARVSILNIKCDKDAPGQGVVDHVDETVSCRYAIAMRSKYACKDAPPPPAPMPTPQPGPPAPPLPTLHDQVFVEVDHGKWSGYGEIFYDSTNPEYTQLLINGTDHGRPFGELSLGYQTQITKAPSRFRSCHYGRPQPPVNNLTAAITAYYGQTEYHYVHFRTGKSVKVNAWAGDKFPMDDDDDDLTLLLLTDVDKGRVVWANGLAFYAGGSVFGRGTTFEFDPDNYHTGLPGGFVFGIPKQWDC